jgi:hypothetical protein
LAAGIDEEWPIVSYISHRSVGATWRLCAEGSRARYWVLSATHVVTSADRRDAQSFCCSVSLVMFLRPQTRGKYRISNTRFSVFDIQKANISRYRTPTCTCLLTYLLLTYLLITYLLTYCLLTYYLLLTYLLTYYLLITYYLLLITYLLITYYLLLTCLLIIYLLITYLLNYLLITYYLLAYLLTYYLLTFLLTYLLTYYLLTY